MIEARIALSTCVRLSYNMDSKSHEHISFFFLERPMKEMLNKSFKLVTEASGTEASLAAMSSPQHSFGLFYSPSKLFPRKCFTVKLTNTTSES